MNIEILDSTLRDGSQGEGISFSVEDKLNIIKALDGLGVAIIEAGNPSSNPKDAEFFARAASLELKNSRLAAFGSTRRKNTPVEQDQTMQALIKYNLPVCVVFGKSWDLHVTEVLNTTLEENLSMITQSLAYLKARGKEVVYDAEHFFDGYKANPDYALKTLQAAKQGGADCITLCDTNGGSFPQEVSQIVAQAAALVGGKIGIHCHNDCGMAVANSILAVENGATHVQGTFIGFGERCGNANLSTIIPNLQLKKGLTCLPGGLENLTRVGRYIAEMSNVLIQNGEPYIGSSAFAHKAGMHADGVSKLSQSFEHINPEQVGNKRRFLMSEMAGRTAVLTKINKIVPGATRDMPQTTAVLEKLKQLENDGYQFEGAESSFELMVRKQFGMYAPFFVLDHFKVISERPNDNLDGAFAMIQITVDGKTETTAAQGDGPVNALDCALRKALEMFYPALKTVRLIDYKVRVIDPGDASGAKVRVLITSTDGANVWTTVGVSEDIIEASWIALVDSLEYKLVQE